MEESTDEVLEQAIFYVENGCYPPGLTKDRKRAVRKRAEQLEYVRETGEVFMRKNEKLLEIVRSVEDRKQKISVCHSGPTSHLGVTKTQKAVADRFYWKGMADDVRDYIRDCPDCQKRNKRSKEGSVEQSRSATPVSESAFDHKQSQHVQIVEQSRSATPVSESAFDHKQSQHVQIEECSQGLGTLVIANSSLSSSVRLGKRNGTIPSGKPAAKIRREGEQLTGKEGMSSTLTGVSVPHPPIRSYEESEHQMGPQDTLLSFPAPYPSGSAESEMLPVEGGTVVDGLPDSAKPLVPLSAIKPPAHAKPWHGFVDESYRQKRLTELCNAMVKGPTVEPVEMQNVVKKEKYLFEMAASREKYHSLVLEEIENVNRGIPLLKTGAKTYSEVPPVQPLPTSNSSLSAPLFQQSPAPSEVSELDEMLCDLPSDDRMETESPASPVAMTVAGTPPNSSLEREPFSEAVRDSVHSYTQAGPPSSDFGTSREAEEPFAETPSTSSQSCTAAVTKHTGRKMFSAEELDLVLRPVLEAVWNQDPESDPFRQPVDPKSLGIPDYFEIVCHPMDLGTMSRRLEEGDYKSPWEFCRDMWLMFDNAWLYNKKTSQVYKYCSKLSEVFDQNIDDAMKSLGYCCGRRFTFHPQVLYCYGKPLCTIPRDTCYYGHKNRFGKYVYCRKCFFEIPDDSISVGDDPMTATSIPKNAFKELKNDSIDYEEMVECIHCGREVHKICVLHYDLIWRDGYKCDKCLKEKGRVRKENQFTAKRLPTTKLSSVLEERVNTFLRMQDADAGEITVRVVSSSDKTLDTRTNMRERFAGEFPEQFPYRAKAMFVFEEIDGNDVCFFGMHVQEYGSDCQAPNTRRVYISYLDSVHFFRPRHLRTQVYHELLIGYLQFCKDNGFLTAHIWACPPRVGDDYIFHCHPAEQKIPKPKRLVEWYKKMLDTAKAQGVILDYKDIIQHCTDEGITSVTKIPYFEGDFWLNVIEETIKELEARERKASEQAAGKGRHPKKAGSTRSKSRRMNPKARIGGDDVSQKIFQAIHKDKEECFVVTLQPPAAAVSSPLPGTTDPDQLIQCDLMDGRDAFLTMAREKHWEFSSLRRARYSTIAMLYELHNQSRDRFVYTCNHCCDHIETRYHCKECDDFDLCVVCYKEVGHSHTMEKLGLGLDDDTTGQDQRVTDPKEQRKAQIQKCIQFLIHASQCRDPTCKQPSCVRMKRVLRHTRDCKLRMSGNCSICKQFLLLCYSHARTCTEDKCPVPVCARIKKTFREQQMQRRRQNERFMQQRMANMNQLSASNNGSNSQHTPSPPVAHTSPPGGSKNPTPSCKGSPASAKAVSNPAAVAASPIAPSSVGHDVLSVIRDIMPHQPGSYGQPLPPSAISQVQPQPHTMMMQNRPQQPMMYHSQQVAPPQQTMMRPTMVQQHPAYHGAGGQQMPPHTLRPPPQYPSAHGPQTAGYPQVLGQQPRPMPSHSPMAQHMLAPTLHQPSLQSTMVVPPLASKYHRSTECSDEPIFCAQPYLGDYHHQLCTGTQTAEQLLFLSQPHSSAHIEHGL